MQKFNKVYIFLLATLVAHFSFVDNSIAQKVYFQRFTLTTGYLSSVPIAGPASASIDLISGLSDELLGGITSDSQGTFIYSDSFSNQIFQVDLLGNKTMLVSSSAGLQIPRAISYDVVNKFLYIADYNNNRIVRVNLSGTLPKTSSADFEEVVEQVSGTTTQINDLKYNASDNYLYWTDNGGSLYRVNPSQSLPINFPDTLTTQVGRIISSIDFDSNTPQNIYFTDLSTFRGLYKASVPKYPAVTIFEGSAIIDISNDPDSSLVIAGIGVEKAGNGICYAFQSTTSAGSIFCASQSAPTMSTIVFTNDNNTAPWYLLIDSSSPPVIVVNPGTIPIAPQVSLNLEGKKPAVVLTLQEFSGAVAKKSTQSALLASLGISAEQAKKAKISFQYNIVLKNLTDANGGKVKKKDQDVRNLTSKRNTLTVKNLKTNSTYTVKYKVEITSKIAGQPLKVIKRTTFSASNGFIVP